MNLLKNEHIMSYLSATENVGFSGIPQNMSDATCATQYKMAVNGLETVPGNCSEAMYTPESSRDDQTFISHLNDNFYTKFKIDPNELYTFHDSDVIAGEITVSHTEDAFVYPESDNEKHDILESPKIEQDIGGAFTNGDVKTEIKKKVLSNGHYNSVSRRDGQKDVKTLHTKAQKGKIQQKEIKREPVIELQVPSQNLMVETCMSPSSTVTSINSNGSNAPPSSSSKQALGETFLDVFKREQGLVENGTVTVKTEPYLPPSPLAMKPPLSPPKKMSTGKSPSSSKARRGRGPAMHEALQRISRRAVPIPVKKWHAPGAFHCGPLASQKPAFRTVDSSSSDEDEIPDIEIGRRPFCIEEIAAESRSARLEFRREAMRKRLEAASHSLRLAKRHTKAKALCSIIKDQVNASGSLTLPPQTVNHLLAMQGMTTLFTSDERRKLRESGWSGGESASSVVSAICTERACAAPSAPCAARCLQHLARAPRRRLRALLQQQHAPPHCTPALSELNACSTSPAYDSSEEPHSAVLTENEYAAASYPHELEVEVVHDGILDPSVLGQMPDEAFTEFLNQEESGTFGESSELTAALEAVLDERELDERELDETELDETELDETELDSGEIEETVLEDETVHSMDDGMFVDSSDTSVENNKMEIPASVSMELSTSGSS